MGTVLGCTENAGTALSSVVLQETDTGSTQKYRPCRQTWTDGLELPLGQSRPEQIAYCVQVVQQKRMVQYMYRYVQYMYLKEKRISILRTGQQHCHAPAHIGPASVVSYCTVQHFTGP